MSILSSHGGFETPVCTARKFQLNNLTVATTKTARDINRRVVLNLIRKHQPVSRADLARRSRLQRSTVSAITEQLIAEDWVTMGALENIPRGRKPTFLHLNGDRAAILGINVQPVETTVAVADLNLRFLAQETMLTSDDPKQFITALCKCIQHMVKTHSRLLFEGIGMVLPGRVDPASGRLTFAPNLQWKALDLKKPIERATGLPVELENAANACALAEIWSGRHLERVRNLIAVTVSEGIGVGMILNGQIVRGVTGLAGEFGHITIQEDGPLCSCGNRGCLEVCASNTAAVRYFSEMVADENGGKPGVTSFGRLQQLVEQGDACACAALHRMAQCLGIGVTMLIAGLSPDVIVLIGEVTSDWRRIGPVIKETVTRRFAGKSHTRILAVNPRTQARLRGAVALVLQKHFSIPQIV